MRRRERRRFFAFGHAPADPTPPVTVPLLGDSFAEFTERNIRGFIDQVFLDPPRRQLAAEIDAQLFYGRD